MISISSICKLQEFTRFEMSLLGKSYLSAFSSEITENPGKFFMNGALVWKQVYLYSLEIVRELLGRAVLSLGGSRALHLLPQ